MNLSSNAKVALITGAARRVGAEIAEVLHGCGYNILLHFHRSRDDAEALADRLNALRSRSVHLVEADLLDVATMARWLPEAVAVWGRLDALINNASAFYPSPIGTVTLSVWEELMGSNLKAPFFLSQAASPYLAVFQGSIVNLGDIYATRPLKNYPVYCMAKAGLIAMTSALAIELAPSVRVNAVSPGAVLWPIENPDPEGRKKILEHIPLGRSGSPLDIARAVRFLLEDAPYVTGQTLSIDGGRSLFI
jgi:pteridine reductase